MYEQTEFDKEIIQKMTGERISLNIEIEDDWLADCPVVTAKTRVLEKTDSKYTEKKFGIMIHANGSPCIRHEVFDKMVNTGWMEADMDPRWAAAIAAFTVVDAALNHYREQNERTEEMAERRDGE